jgi:pilus assembly protein CpaE
MKTRTSDVYVVSADHAIVQQIGNTVDTCEHLSSAGTFRTLEELAVELDRHGATAVIVDIDAHPEDMLADLEPIVGRYGGTRFVVVATEQRTDWMLEAMQAGARHFLPKSAVSADLRGVLDRLVPLSVTDNGFDPRGVVTVLSAGGGTGSTTVAVNLAQELHELSSVPTLLVDLDCRHGGAAGYLGATHQYGIADILADADRIDAHLVRSTAIAVRDHLHMLVSPATVNMDRPQELDWSHLRSAIRSIRQAYAYTVIDAPHMGMDAAADLAKSSAVTFLVFQMNVDDIRIARAMLTALVERGASPDRILPLANRCRPRRDMITVAEAKKSLDIERMSMLSNDYKHAVASLNYGQTLAQIAPRSSLRREIKQLAALVRRAVAGTVTTAGTK